MVPQSFPSFALLLVAVVSFCVLAAEITLTRVFSVLFRADYVFLVLSGAIAGLGAGALLAPMVPVEPTRMGRWTAWVAILFAIALAAPVLVLLVSPWGRSLVAGAETAVVVILPMGIFAAAGLLLSVLFRRHQTQSGLLYFADLGAAALAAPSSVWLLDRLGAVRALLVLAVLAATAATIAALRAPRSGSAIVAMVSLASLGGVLVSDLRRQWIVLPPLKMPAEAFNDPSHPWHRVTKPLFARLADPLARVRIVRTDWTALVRSDVVFDAATGFHYIYADGDVPTQMEPWDGRISGKGLDRFPFIGALPYRLAVRPPSDVLAIGSGGGMDVLLALEAGARHVDALEINPAIPRIVADPQFAGTTAALYRQPGVRLIVDEGRSFLRRSGKYDTIYFACAKTATSQQGGIALLDNYLYTGEAFEDYWRHLTPDGTLALVTQESFLIDRLLITALAMLRREGMSAEDAAKRVLTARVPLAQFGRGPYRHILLMRRSAWPPGEMGKVRAVIASSNLEPLHLPHDESRGAEGARFDSGADPPVIRTALEAQYPYGTDPVATMAGSNRDRTAANLAPVTDDRPFYLDIARGSHPTLSILMVWTGLFAAFVVGITAACQARRKQSGDEAAVSAPRAAAPVGYFALIGAGFIMVEIALIQRFVLLLGFPTRSLTVTLFVMLLGAGAGSMLCQRGSPLQAAARMRKLMPALAALLVFYWVGLNALLDLAIAQPLAVRVGAAALLLFPAGMLMGMPFPAALRCASGSWNALVPGFWSVNGAFTLFGSVAAMTVARSAGYGAVLVTGAACYMGAWALGRWMLEIEPPG